jgi:hypothetical protein
VLQTANPESVVLIYQMVEQQVAMIPKPKPKEEVSNEQC